MSRIKGRWVGLVEIDFDCETEKEKGLKPFDTIYDAIVNGALTEEIKSLLSDEVVDDSLGKVTVTQQYADLVQMD